ncbi:Uncharacterised protein [Mycobacteroides abscessus]|nr:Uncharacterised protein [Mycobacteroides abscessus]
MPAATSAGTPACSAMSAIWASVRVSLPSWGWFWNIAVLKSFIDSGARSATQAAAAAERVENCCDCATRSRIEIGCSTTVTSPDSRSWSSAAPFVSSNWPQMGHM